MATQEDSEYLSEGHIGGIRDFIYGCIVSDD